MPTARARPSRWLPTKATVLSYGTMWLGLLAVGCALLTVLYAGSASMPEPAGGLRRDMAHALAFAMLSTAFLAVLLAGSSRGWRLRAIRCLPALPLVAGAFWLTGNVEDDLARDHARIEAAATRMGEVRAVLATVTLDVSDAMELGYALDRANAAMADRVDPYGSLGRFAAVATGRETCIRDLDGRCDAGRTYGDPWTEAVRIVTGGPVRDWDAIDEALGTAQAITVVAGRPASGGTKSKPSWTKVRGD